MASPDPSTPRRDVDKTLAATAYKKLMAGQALSASEQAALRRYEKSKEESLRWAYYREIPQKHWREMSGRQTKVLNEQAALYGIPFGGPRINLPAVVKGLHDFLAANARKLAAEDDELLAANPASLALEEYRRERAHLARLERQERDRTLLPRDAMRVYLLRVALIVRNLGEALAREFGPIAATMLDEALEEAQREIDRSFAG